LVSALAVWYIALGGCHAAASNIAPQAALQSNVPLPIELPLVEVAAGSLPGGAGSEPTLGVIRTAAELLELHRCVDSSIPSTLLSISLSQQVLIVAFLGLRPSGGYSLRLRSASVQGDVLVVTALLDVPQPGAPVTQGFETPVHVVKVLLPLRDAQSLLRYRLLDASGTLLRDGALGRPICPGHSAAIPAS
jgi:hypothetical protein